MPFYALTCEYHDSSPHLNHLGYPAQFSVLGLIQADTLKDAQSHAEQLRKMRPRRDSVDFPYSNPVFSVQETVPIQNVQDVLDNNRDFFAKFTDWPTVAWTDEKAS